MVPASPAIDASQPAGDVELAFDPAPPTEDIRVRQTRTVRTRTPACVTAIAGNRVVADRQGFSAWNCVTTSFRNNQMRPAYAAILLILI